MQKNNLKKYRSVIILVVLFFLPIGSAFYIFSQPMLLRKLSTTNYGQWAPQLDWQLNKPKARPWQLVLWQNGPCEQQCMQQLDQLARIRLAMGRKVYELSLVLLVPEGMQLTKQQTDQLKDNNIDYQYLPREKVPTWNKNFQVKPVVLFSPEHLSILMYPKDLEPKKMYHDLQVLIK
ncbi:MAG: hypothetical protein QG556_833 [Pseudomonadota bacterium]|nr:hypothetical protein [Pseudomonadota bacterium]